jgi:hypothetical protein
MFLLKMFFRLAFGKREKRMKIKRKTEALRSTAFPLNLPYPNAMIFDLLLLLLSQKKNERGLFTKKKKINERKRTIEEKKRYKENQKRK